MFNVGVETIVADILWILVVVGWFTLIMVGLEADKPLSGGLPGHVYFAEDDGSDTWSSGDQIAATVAWVLFGATAATLPFILWWIFTRH